MDGIGGEEVCEVREVCWCVADLFQDDEDRCEVEVGREKRF